MKDMPGDGATVATGDGRDPGEFLAGSQVRRAGRGTGATVAGVERCAGRPGERVACA